jgi:hypothetical protein
VIRWLALGCAAIVACSGQDHAGASAGEANAVTEPAPTSTSSQPQRATSYPLAPEATYPLKEWMTSNLNRPLRTTNFDELGKSLATAATYAPQRFADWRQIAEQGAAAAAAHDLDGVRASCNDCHTKYRAEYKKIMRTQPLVANGVEVGQ